MGYLRYECIVVNGWSAEEVLNAYRIALLECGTLVSSIVLHPSNGGASFLIAPDGSKEGWVDSDISETARKSFITRIELLGIKVDWALIRMGGDDDEFRVLDSSGVTKT
jgi:hypothetical protein